MLILENLKNCILIKPIINANQSMSFDILKIFQEIKNHKNDTEINNFMTRIINLCSEMKTDEGWLLFNKLDYSVEVKKLAEHVVSTLKEEPSPFVDKGFWFGIADDGTLSFAVSNQYIDADDNLDWIFEAETHYPETREFNSQIMKSIYSLSNKETDLSNYAEYPLFLAYGLKVAQAAMAYYKTIYPDRKVGYSVGFDSGDFITMGWI